MYVCKVDLLFREFIFVRMKNWSCHKSKTFVTLHREVGFITLLTS